MGSRAQDIQLSKSLCYNPFFVCRSVSLYSNHTTNGCRPVTPLALSTKESCADCKWLRKKGNVNLRRHDYSLICWNEEWNWDTDLRRILHNVYLLWHYPNTTFLFPDFWLLCGQSVWIHLRGKFQVLEPGVRNSLLVISEIFFALYVFFQS